MYYRSMNGSEISVMRSWLGSGQLLKSTILARNGDFLMPSNIDPRCIRQRDAANYLGTNVNWFNEHVRPHLTEIPIGTQGIGYDRLDLDAWFEEYKSRNGRPGKRKGAQKPWDVRKSLGSSTGKGYGTSTKLSEEEEFAKALERATSKKRKGS